MMNIHPSGNIGIYNSISFFLFFFDCKVIQMAEELLLSVDDAIEYVRNNVNVGDTLEISYNRIFAPGEVLSVIEEDEVTGEGLRVNLQLNGEILNQAVEIDFNEIYDDLLEMNHITDDKEVVIEIDF